MYIHYTREHASPSPGSLKMTILVITEKAVAIFMSGAVEAVLALLLLFSLVVIHHYNSNNDY